MLTRIARFLKAKDGLAAIEFAFIAPVLVTLLFGTIEMGNALECRQKVTSLASTAADLVAQTASVSSGDLTNIFNAVSAIVYPFTGTATIVVSSVESDGKGGGTVVWSKSSTGSGGLSPGAAVALSTPLMSTCDTSNSTSCTPCAKNTCSVIYATVSYNYTSPLGKLLVGTVPMKDSFYARPRKSALVAFSG
jgi:Flp pilus assembly protein TadG